MIKREKYIKQILHAWEFLPIVILIGARQVGKTSIMQTIPQDNYKSHLFLNGQNPEVANIFSDYSALESYLKTYLNPELDGLLMVDEFQYINHVSTSLKLLTDSYPALKVLCSGSSSLDIMQHIEESLAGRVRIIEVLSLSFDEYLLFVDKQKHQLLHSVGIIESEILRQQLQPLYNQYLIYGGFPRVALAQNEEDKVELINDIYHTYLLNDVRRYVRNEHFVGFDRLLRLLAAQIGNLVNINELSRSSCLTYDMCEKYLHLLEQMYIIRLLEPYASNVRKVISKMKKVYFYDLGLRNVIVGSVSSIDYRTDNGAIFENETMLTLWRNKRPSETLYFYRQQNGTEVDFYLSGPQRRMMFECKYKSFEMPKRIKSLSQIATDEGVEDTYVINQNLYSTDTDVKYIPEMLLSQL